MKYLLVKTNKCFFKCRPTVHICYGDIYMTSTAKVLNVKGVKEEKQEHIVSTEPGVLRYFIIIRFIMDLRNALVCLLEEY